MITAARRLLKGALCVVALITGFVQTSIGLTDFMSAGPSTATDFETLVIPALVIFPFMGLIGACYPANRPWLPLTISGAVPAVILLVLTPWAGFVLLVFISASIGAGAWAGSRVMKLFRARRSVAHKP